MIFRSFDYPGKNGSMRYHDFHLREYTVSDFGRRITLHLVFDYEGIPKEESFIEFKDVALYNFTHTGGAIITDILETSVAELLDEMGASLAHWANQYGVDAWQDSLEDFQRHLESTGQKAWRIDSALCFEGFVIAKSVGQVESRR